MAPMDVSLSLTAELAALPWMLVAALVISGIALIACTDAADRIRHACAAFVSHGRIRFVVDYVIGLRLRHLA